MTPARSLLLSVLLAACRTPAEPPTPNASQVELPGADDPVQPMARPIGARCFDATPGIHESLGLLPDGSLLTTRRLDPRSRDDLVLHRVTAEESQELGRVGLPQPQVWGEHILLARETPVPSTEGTAFRSKALQKRTPNDSRACSQRRTSRLGRSTTG